MVLEGKACNLTGCLVNPLLLVVPVAGRQNKIHEALPQIHWGHEVSDTLNHASYASQLILEERQGLIWHMDRKHDERYYLMSTYSYSIPANQLSFKPFFSILKPCLSQRHLCCECLSSKQQQPLYSAISL
jgi:hypothetical protein